MKLKKIDDEQIEKLITSYYKKLSMAKQDHDFKQYEYQEDVAKAILKGENVILQAPTGAGKTLASIMPYIIARNEEIVFPNKLIYSTPRRTLVNSLYKDIYNEIKQSEFDDGIKNSLKISIQTGEYPQDRLFKSDIVFTTFDQTLSSFLSIPISLSKNLSNINVAAIFTSYLVFDEFHLFEDNRSLTTTLCMLKRLRELNIRFCIMTATISDEKINAIAKELKATVIKADSGEYIKDIDSLKGKKRYIHIENGSLNAKKIIESHLAINQDKNHSKKSIVMCNRVKTAKKIYVELKKIKEKDKLDFELILIHSQFLQKDRKTKEELIKKLFKKDAKNSNVILVSTQVIEVGIDITSHVMHTEISPIDSLLQRIGRLARYKDEEGQIYVYDVDSDSYLPYDEDLTEQTYIQLSKHNNDLLTAELSQQLIDIIYTEYDEKAKEKLEGSGCTFINETWQNPDKKEYDEYIRNIISCNTIIRFEIPPGESPYDYESVSINPFSLESVVKKIYKENAIKEITNNWIVKEVVEEDGKFKFLYPKDNKLYPNSIYLLNPEYFHYNSDIGFYDELEKRDFEIGNNSNHIFDKLPDDLREPRPKANYEEEDFCHHINLMLLEYRKIKKHLSWAIDSITKLLKIDNATFDDIIELIIWAHDLGKLQDDWQVAHQRKKYEFVAHSKRLGKPPQHAVESFWIIAELIDDFLDEYIGITDSIFGQRLQRVITKTIVSHHSINHDKIRSFLIKENVRDYLVKNLNFTNQRLNEFIKEHVNTLKLKKSCEKTFDTQGSLITPNDYLLYFLLVRILRIIDQEATSKIN